MTEIYQKRNTLPTVILNLITTYIPDRKSYIIFWLSVNGFYNEISSIIMSYDYFLEGKYDHTLDDNDDYIWNIYVGDNSPSFILGLPNENIATTSYNRYTGNATIKILNEISGKCLFSLEANDDQIFNRIATKDGKLIICYRRKTIIWDTNTGIQLLTIPNTGNILRILSHILNIIRIILVIEDDIHILTYDSSINVIINTQIIHFKVKFLEIWSKNIFITVSNSNNIDIWEEDIEFRIIKISSFVPLDIRIFKIVENKTIIYGILDGKNYIEILDNILDIEKLSYKKELMKKLLIEESYIKRTWWKKIVNIIYLPDNRLICFWGYGPMEIYNMTNYTKEYSYIPNNGYHIVWDTVTLLNDNSIAIVLISKDNVQNPYIEIHSTLSYNSIQIYPKSYINMIYITQLRNNKLAVGPCNGQIEIYC